MKQRVKLAQALVHDPDLLLLDEPTNGLDPEGREEMLALIRDVSARREMSLILCSHLLRDVEPVCEHVIVLNQGEVAAAGRIAELTGPAPLDLRRARQGRRGGVPDRPQGPRAASGARARTAIRVFMTDGAGPELIFRVARGVRRAGPLPAAGRREPRGRVPARAGPRGAGARCRSTSRPTGATRRASRCAQVRFWPITREALRLILAKRAFLGLLRAGLAAVPRVR